MHLCCDLGGNSAEWAIVDERGEIFLRLTLQLTDFEDFDEMLDRAVMPWAAKANCALKSACIAVGGRIEGSCVRLTNVEGWELRASNVQGILADHGHDALVHLINDFEALSFGVLQILRGEADRAKLVELHGRYKFAPPRPGEIRGRRALVCGPGTGLGVACILGGDGDATPTIMSSEGGHHSLAPESLEQYRFVGFSNRSIAKVSYEDALSKQGLQNIYNFYRKEVYSLEQDYGIDAKRIIDLAGSGRDHAATDSLGLFCEILANFCGNLALTFNCDRAIFLWGSLLIDMPFDLLKSRFKQHYAERCMHGDRINNVPVVLLRDAEIPLHGCAVRCALAN